MSMRHSNDDKLPDGALDIVIHVPSYGTQLPFNDLSLRQSTYLSVHNILANHGLYQVSNNYNIGIDAIHQYCNKTGKNITQNLIIFITYFVEILCVLLGWSSG